MFENEVPSAQRIKANFVTNLWSWANLHSVDNTHSVVDFLHGWGVGSFFFWVIFFSFVVVLCSSALLYMTRVFQGSSVFVPLFWFVYKIAFYRSKKK